MMRRIRIRTRRLRRWAALGLMVLAGPAAALELRGPDLAAASNFGQGWLGRLFHVATQAGVRDFRDAVYWADIERAGIYSFDTDESSWPGRLPLGAGMSLTVNNGHPEHDGGVTPHSPGAVEAFAQAAAATVARFPAIHSVEVGNEVNAANFVTGPLAEGTLTARATGYLALLRATHEAVKATAPQVRILGGALHSVPLGYLAPLMEAGAADYMDALALHPYTTPPEQFGRQIALLRRLPGLAEMPLEVTEFGDPNPETAPHHLLKSYCAFALAGVTRAAWYPLHPRGDGLAPMFTAQARLTALGQAYLHLQTRLAGQSVRDVGPDPFTYACAFGPEAAPSALVIWGMERSLELAPGLTAVDATGAAAPARVTPERPLVIAGTVAPVLGDTVRLGPAPQHRLADSFDQFAYGAGPGGFEVLARDRGGEVPLIMRPGQERPATFWTPYLGLEDRPDLRVTADHLLPAGGGRRATAVIHRHTLAADQSAATLRITLAPPERSADGVKVQVTVGGALVLTQTVTDPVDLRLPLGALAQGTVIEISVGPGGNARGDLVAYRYRLLGG